MKFIKCTYCAKEPIAAAIYEGSAVYRTENKNEFAIRLDNPIAMIHAGCGQIMGTAYPDGHFTEAK